MRQGSSSPPQSNCAGQQNQKVSKKQHFKNLQIFQVDIQADTMKSPQVVKCETKTVSELTTRISSAMRHHCTFHFLICSQKHHSENLKFNKKSDYQALSISLQGMFRQHCYSVLWNWNIFHHFSFRSYYSFFGINLA